MVGLKDLCQHARTGDEIIVDSYRGEVVLHPSGATIEAYLHAVAGLQRLPVDLADSRRLD